jgi:hypothetical protein
MITEETPTLRFRWLETKGPWPGKVLQQLWTVVEFTTHDEQEMGRPSSAREEWRDIPTIHLPTV